MVLLYRFVVEDQTISALSKPFINSVFQLNAGHLSTEVHFDFTFLKCLGLLEKNN